MLTVFSRMEEQPAASGEGSSVDPDHMSVDDPQKSNPESCSQSGTRPEPGPVENAVEATEGVVSHPVCPHGEQLNDLLKDLTGLMPKEVFKSVQSLVGGCRNQTPVESTSLIDLLQYLKTIHRTPDKVRKTSDTRSSNSSSTSSSRYSYLYIVKVFPVVTGKTCGADEEILERLKKVGKISTMEITTDLQDCDVIILFCPIVSRAGTDVDAAMKSVPGDKKVILVVMHHTRHADYSVDEKKTWSDDFSNIVLNVHVLFHETQRGLLKCKRNDKAVKQIRDALQKHSKNRFTLS